MDVTEILAENARRLRRERGLSQRALAKISGLTQPAISQMEHGGRDPRLDTLEKLAEALGVSVADLLTAPGEAEKAALVPKVRAPKRGAGPREPRTGGVTTKLLGPEELTLLQATEGVDEEAAAFAAKVRPIVEEIVRETLAERERQASRERH